MIHIHGSGVPRDCLNLQHVSVAIFRTDEKIIPELLSDVRYMCAYVVIGDIRILMASPYICNNLLPTDHCSYIFQKCFQKYLFGLRQVYLAIVYENFSALFVETYGFMIQDSGVFYAMGTSQYGVYSGH